MIRIRVERPTITIGASIHLDRDETPEMLAKCARSHQNSRHHRMRQSKCCTTSNIHKGLLKLMLSQSLSSHHPSFRLPFRPWPGPSSSDCVAR